MAAPRLPASLYRAMIAVGVAGGQREWAWRVLTRSVGNQLASMATFLVAAADAAVQSGTSRGFVEFGRTFLVSPVTCPVGTWNGQMST